MYSETAEETVWRETAAESARRHACFPPHTQPRKETQEPTLLIILTVFFFFATTCTDLETHKPFITCGCCWCKTPVYRKELFITVIQDLFQGCYWFTGHMIRWRVFFRARNAAADPDHVVSNSINVEILAFPPKFEKKSLNPNNC